jgi:hypothetical protein
LRCENKPRVNEEIGARGTGRVTLRYVREFHHTPRYFNININNCRLGIVIWIDTVTYLCDRVTCRLAQTTGRGSDLKHTHRSGRIHSIHRPLSFVQNITYIVSFHPISDSSHRLCTYSTSSHHTNTYRPISNIQESKSVSRTRRYSKMSGLALPTSNAPIQPAPPPASGSGSGSAGPSNVKPNPTSNGTNIKKRVAIAPPPNSKEKSPSPAEEEEEDDEDEDDDQPRKKKKKTKSSSGDYKYSNEIAAMVCPLCYIWASLIYRCLSLVKSKNHCRRLSSLWKM